MLYVFGNFEVFRERGPVSFYAWRKIENCILIIRSFLHNFIYTQRTLWCLQILLKKVQYVQGKKSNVLLFNKILLNFNKLKSNSFLPKFKFYKHFTFYTYVGVGYISYTFPYISQFIPFQHRGNYFKYRVFIKKYIHTTSFHLFMLRLFHIICNHYIHSYTYLLFEK